MSETRSRLEEYLTRTGMSRPSDAAQQYQVALMRQWADHLDIVLEHNMPDWPELRSTIIREFIYGAVPQAAEAELRETLVMEMRAMAERGPGLFPGDPGLPVLVPPPRPSDQEAMERVRAQIAAWAAEGRKFFIRRDWDPLLGEVQRTPSWLYATIFPKLTRDGVLARRMNGRLIRWEILAEEEQ